MHRVVLSFIVLSAMRLHDYNWCVMILSETYKGRAFIKCHSRVTREQISNETHFIHIGGFCLHPNGACAFVHVCVFLDA